MTPCIVPLICPSPLHPHPLSPSPSSPTIKHCWREGEGEPDRYRVRFIQRKGVLARLPSPSRAQREEEGEGPGVRVATPPCSIRRNDIERVFVHETQTLAVWQPPQARQL